MSDKKTVKVEEFPDTLIAWVKDTFVTGPTGEKLLLNTVVRINNQLIALDPYSDSDLNKLQEVVNEAVEHEKSRRKSSSNNSDLSG